MDTFLPASGMIAAIFLLAASLVSMGAEDRELIAEISDMLGMARRFSLSKGWVAESKASRSRIWVSRWEDVTYGMADLMIFVALAQPLPFPFVLANVKRATTEFPFDTQFSRTKDMEEPDVPEVGNALFTYCCKNDRDCCVGVIRQIGDVLPRFGRIADERRALRTKKHSDKP